MKNKLQRSERYLEIYARWIIRYRWPTIALILVVSVVLAMQMRHMRMDTSLEAHLDPKDPAIQTYKQFRDQFGNEEVILIGISTKDVFRMPFLSKLKRLHQDLESNTPYLESINSLVNARETRGKKNELIVGELLENLPKNDRELAALKRFVLHNPNYLNQVISPDATFTTIVITASRLAKSDPTDMDNSLANIQAIESKAENSPYGSYKPALTKEQNTQVVDSIRKILHQYESADFQIYYSGNPVVTNYLGKRMGVDMQRFMGGGVILVFLLLAILFRRISGVLLPLAVVLLGVLLSISLMAALGVSMKSSTVILPSFLLAVGISDSVHILSIFYRHLSQGTEKNEAIVATLKQSGMPIIYTSITTAAGLWSFSTSSVALVAELGIYAGFGVMICLLLSLGFLPALLAVIPFKARPITGTAPKMLKVDHLMAAIGKFAVEHASFVIGSAVVVTVLAGIGIAQLKFAHDVLTWLPASSKVRTDTEMIDRRMGGTINVEMLVDTGKENGLYNPAVMTSLDRIGRYLKSQKDTDGTPKVGSVFSPAEMLKEINYALNEEKPGSWAIPQDRKIIAQELFLFENSGSDDLEGVMDIQFRKARFSARIPWRDVSQNNELIESARAKANELIKPPNTVTFTGMTALFARTGHETMISMRNSYFIAGIVITLLMCILLKSVKRGLISMIPNLLPILITLGLMGWLGIPVDVFTMTIGSIALGLCVDDTIHFMHRFFIYHRQTGDVRDSVHRTLTTVGRAMLFTSVLLFVCFMLYSLASLSIVIYFGVLIAVTIFFALLCDVFLSPAIMEKVMKSRP